MHLKGASTGCMIGSRRLGGIQQKMMKPSATGASAAVVAYACRGVVVSRWLLVISLVSAPEARETQASN